MGARSKYSKESILESLLQLNDSGIELTINGLTSSGNSGLLAAINRHKRENRHLRFFKDLHDAREKLAEYVATTLNDPKKAEAIRKYNEPRKRIKYNKRAIKQGLLEHFDAGGGLTGEEIQKTWMHNAIYYKYGKTKTYNSLFEAREALANFLEKKDRFDDAEKVRKYNDGPDRKMPESERELIRIELIEVLHKKVESGQDLGHRAQQKIDRGFVNRCNYYFGSYANIFDAAGLDYKGFANRLLNKSPEEYFSKFLDLIENAGTLQRAKLEKINKKLIERINEYESGYFQALEKARLYYVGRMDFDRVRYIDEFLFSDEKCFRDTKSKESALKRQELTESIIFFDSKTLYDSSTLYKNNFLTQTFKGIDGKMTGKEIMDLATISGEWLESVPLSNSIIMERSNIKRLFYTYSDRIIKIGFGNQQKYLFHYSIISEERNNGKIFDRIVEKEFDDMSRSSAERKYFRKIIIPKLNVRLKDKPKYSPEEIRWWIYEFGGSRAIESLIEKKTTEWPKEDRERALIEMRKLSEEYIRHKEDNVYSRIQQILSKNKK